MTDRTPRFITLGLCLLMGGLFATAFQLNRSHYASSTGNVPASYSRLLEQEAQALKRELEKQEAESFAAFAQPWTVVADDLFVIKPTRVVPAATAALLETIPHDAAHEAYQNGLAALPDRSALPHFKAAAKLPPQTADDLYRKTAALFNVLELEPDLRTVCCILTLLDHAAPALSDSQRRFFRNTLAQQVPQLDRIEAQLIQTRKTAAAIDRQLTRQKGDYRVILKNQILSVRQDGLALLYSPRLQPHPPVIVSSLNTTALGAALLPGLYAAIPESIITEARQDLQQQYRTGNLILGLMALLGIALISTLAAAGKRQRRLDAMRTEFVATVSHELRTPLSLIRLHAETLKHGRIPPEKIAAYHQTILTEAERLTGIVNNVLDFSRMQRNQLQIHLESTDLSQLVQRIADSFADRLKQEGFALECNIAPDIRANVDPLAYSQIVFNLLDNAIKYSDGAKTIRTELETADPSVILRIIDFGIGIPDRLKKQIFNEFVRADDARVTARRGSGIGLSVATQLAERMNASIEVADNQPQGSVFTLTLNSNRITGPKNHEIIGG